MEQGVWEAANYSSPTETYAWKKNDKSKWVIAGGVTITSRNKEDFITKKPLVIYLGKLTKIQSELNKEIRLRLGDI